METKGAVLDDTEESTQKKSKKCAMDLKSMLLVSLLKAASVEWVGFGVCRK